MKKFLSILVLGLLVSAAASAECYKMKLGNYNDIAKFETHQYLCIKENTVSIWNGTGINTLVTEYLGCTKTVMNSYNPTLLDGTSTTLFDPNMVVCKHGLVVAYKTPAVGELAKLVMGGMLYTITPTSINIPVTGPFGSPDEQ